MEMTDDEKKFLKWFEKSLRDENVIWKEKYHGFSPDSGWLEGPESAKASINNLTEVIKFYKPDYNSNRSFNKELYKLYTRVKTEEEKRKSVISLSNFLRKVGL